MPELFLILVFVLEPRTLLPRRRQLHRTFLPVTAQVSAASTPRFFLHKQFVFDVKAPSSPFDMLRCWLRRIKRRRATVYRGELASDCYGCSGYCQKMSCPLSTVRAGLEALTRFHEDLHENLLHGETGIQEHDLSRFTHRFGIWDGMK